LKLGGLEVQTLWPPYDEQIDKSNLTSLVLLLHYGNQRFLLTGDIDQSIEARLLEDPNLPKLDYLKVAHHGSKTSSSEPFLAQTRPSLAVVSAGYQNNFNHPNPAVLHRLNQSRTLLLRTDRMGQITVLADGKKLTTDPFIYRSPNSLGWIPFTQALE
jgi:competence protein ComEC